MSALLWLPMRSQFWADNGVEILTNGDFEAGGSPPAGWAQLNSVCTTENGGRPGSAGSHHARVAYDGSHPTGTMRETGILTLNRKYVGKGWYQCSSGGQSIAIGDSGVAWGSAPTVPSWTFFRTPEAVCAGTAFNLQGVGLAAGQYVEFDDWSVQEQFMYTQNLGSLKGKVQCGDGRTAATFPTQLYPRGCSFNGSQYMNHVAAPALYGSVSFGCFVRMTKSINYIPVLGYADANNGRQLSAEVSAGKRIPVLYTKGWSNYITGSTDLADGLWHSLWGTYEAVSGIASIYVDGKVDNSGAKAANADAANRDFGIGTAFGGTYMTGSMTCVARYPYAITPTGIRDLDQRMRVEANT